jgi:hypothetical protein
LTQHRPPFLALNRSGDDGEIRLQESPHSLCVTAWVDRVPHDLPAVRLVEVLERGFGALWRRAYRTLGDVTLTAIADRVLHTAIGRFPAIAAVTLGGNGPEFGALRDAEPVIPPEQLRQAIQFVLLEFLTVLGNLTADVLTPGLHEELSSVAPEARQS